MGSERNELFVPPSQATPVRRECPKCKSQDFGGHRVQGVITFTCRACKNQWQGGLQLPADPRVPAPTSSYVPPSRFVQSDRNPGELVEVRRRVDVSPDYRKGAPVPQGED